MLSRQELLDLWRTELFNPPFHTLDRILAEMKSRNLFPDEYNLTTNSSMQTDDLNYITRLLKPYKDEIEGSMYKYGLYPDTSDPNFIEKLLKKTEFADTISTKLNPAESPCSSSGLDFEITPVQRFVANFLHPRTPYKSVLLYHGVGVGKTCAAISSAEAYLDTYPNKKILIVAPKNIQSGFIRTIFDIEKLVLGKGDAPNTVNGCTGNTYLRLTGSERIRDKELIQKRVIKAINTRYDIYGYIEFRNYIKNILSTISQVGDDETIRLREIQALKDVFNYRLLIIDEAHNLRDIEGTSSSFMDVKDIDTMDEEKEEHGAGKALTPYLLRLLKSVDGMKLCLMTATPMFNTVFEIVFLLNLLLINDKKAEISIEKILNIDGTLAPTADKVLRPIANAYVSFMRGENPISFPVRLMPENRQRLTKESYPIFQLPLKRIQVDRPEKIQQKVRESDVERMAQLPIVYSQPLENDSYYTSIIKSLTNAKIESGGTGYQVIDSLLQAGNCVFPGSNSNESSQSNESNDSNDSSQSNDSNDSNDSNESRQSNDSNNSNESNNSSESNNSNESNESNNSSNLSNSNTNSTTSNININDAEFYVGIQGFNQAFTKKAKGAVEAKDPSWLESNTIGKYSPKCATILNSLQNMEGVGFVYSRFVTVGAFFLALILEANGYTPYNRKEPFLTNGIQTKNGRQCALCSYQEKEHTISDKDHAFVPAKYVILSGDTNISPNNAASIAAARGEKNVNGEIVKVILGSQIAGEGLDLRFIREIHILDAWFHLNKTEQIIGRGIRFCSHALIKEPEKRNTTIFLHTIMLPKSFNRETADLYCYRSALKKALEIGKVSRKLKQFAIDCNLRKSVTVLHGLGNRIQIDSQGKERKGNDPRKPGIPMDDTNFTVMCDWMECEYTCAPEVSVNIELSDTSTYNTFSAQFHESLILKQIQKLFEKKSYYSEADLKNILSQKGIAMTAIEMILHTIENNSQINIQINNHKGYIIKKNNYYIFQPYVYRDLGIPIALRIADFPIKRDTYEPGVLATDTNISEQELKNTEVKEQTLLEEKTKESFWNILIEWVKSVLYGSQTRISIDLERQIEVFKEYKEEVSVQMDKLLMIVYLAKKEINKDLFLEVVQEYLWDQWFTPNEQLRILLQSKNPIFYTIASETIQTSGSTTAFRTINPNTGSLTYTCSNGKPCSRGVIEVFEQLENDDVKKRSHAPNDVGSLYGIIVPKRGNLVFKTTEPLPKFKAVSGQECAIITTKSQWKDKLLSIGNELKKENRPVLDLDKEHLTASSDITNSTRGCAVLELVLRYVDKLQLQRKRWFFRPIAAYMSGHRGLISKEAKLEEKAAQKEISKYEATVDIPKPQKKRTKKSIKTVPIV